VTLLAAFDVVGTPVPQGSMKHVGGGRIVPSNALALRRWRKAVAAAAAEAYDEPEPYDGAVVVDCVFRLARPKSRRKAGPFPSTGADGDKLLRAVNDAITGIVITNDARVVDQRSTKVYADVPTLPLYEGAYVAVHALDDRSSDAIVAELPCRTHLRAA